MYQTDLILVNYLWESGFFLIMFQKWFFFFKLWFGGLGRCVEGKTQLFIFMNLGLNSTSAATAAMSLQSCPTLCDPIDGSPPGSPVPGILQARTLEGVAISFSSA